LHEARAAAALEHPHIGVIHEVGESDGITFIAMELIRGEKLSEVIKQPQYQPLPVEKQVAILYAATTGRLDDIPTPRVKEFETQFYRFLETEHANVLDELGKTKNLTDELAKALDDALVEFRESFLA